MSKGCLKKKKCVLQALFRHTVSLILMIMSSIPMYQSVLARKQGFNARYTNIYKNLQDWLTMATHTVRSGRVQKVCVLEIWRIQSGTQYSVLSKYVQEAEGPIKKGWRVCTGCQEMTSKVKATKAGAEETKAILLSVFLLDSILAIIPLRVALRCPGLCWANSDGCYLLKLIQSVNYYN